MTLSIKRLQSLLMILVMLFMVITVPGRASSEKFVAISAGGFHTLALADDGTVWAWGNMYSELNSQIGNESASIHQVPISDVVAIAAGYSDSYVLKSDGTIWAWGPNYCGELGDGTTEARYTPVQVSGLSNVTEISAGSLYGVALKSDGTVWTWGYNKGENNNGRLGDGTRENKLTPVQVKGLANVKKIMGSCFAIKGDGTVWTWGNALNMTDSREAFQVLWLANIKFIDMDYGYGHALFIREDGTVWSWGYNDNGQFGNGTFMRGHLYFNETFQAEGLTDIRSVSAGHMTSMALKNDGTVWVWGHNQGGMLGTGQLNELELTPVMIQGFDGVVDISSKSSHSVFLKEDGSIYECGVNSSGQMGNSSIVGAYIKVLTLGDTSIKYIDKPVKILGPGTSIPSDINTIETHNPSVSSTIPHQDNGLLNIVIAVCALIIIGCCIVYFSVIRKM